MDQIVICCDFDGTVTEKDNIIAMMKNTHSFNIVIGDSVTDLEAAKQADFVLARDLLLEKCG